MVETRFMKIDPRVIDVGQIQTVVDVLDQEEVILYPTDTFYGLGAKFLSPKARRRVYEIKRRDPRKPLAVVVSDLDMLEGLSLDIPPVFRTLAAEFWPGPLTLVFGRKSGRQSLNDRDDSLGVRLPDHPWVRALVRRAGYPITASSANISGESEISEPGETLKVFVGKVALVVEGGRTQGVKPSTVLDLRGGRPMLLREGAIPFSSLAKYLA